MPTKLPVPLHIHDSLQEGISQYQPAPTKVLAEAHVCVCDVFALLSRGPAVLIISFPVKVINIIPNFINLLTYLYE
jgi:hypothetical protein